MASVLAKNNYDVTVLEWDRSSRLPATEESERLHVHRMKCRAPYGPNLVFFLPIWWLYVSVFVMLGTFEVVQPQNLDNLLPAWLFSKIKMTKIVYDIADFYADTYVYPKLVIIRRFVSWIETFLISQVDHTIIVDESRQQQIGGQFSNFSVIYNSPPDKYGIFSDNPNCTPLKNSALVIFYAGILARDRGLSIMVEAIKGLPKVNLIVAGFGCMEKAFRDMIKDICNIEYLGRLPYEKVLELTFRCDCLLALYDPTVPNNVFASPNKLFEAMMCRKPIIVNEGTAMAHVVTKEKCGIVVKYGDVQGLRAALARLKTDQDLRNSLGINGRKAYQASYDWKLMKDRLLKVYELPFQSSR